jgi:hypothetical protein
MDASSTHAPESLPGLELAELELALKGLEAEPMKEAASTPAEPDGAASIDLETVELELTLQHEDLMKLPFEDSVRVALDRLGGKLLFQMRLDNAGDCQRVAAVRLGDKEEEQFALIIMPQGGRSIRVEAASESDNPLARIAESYAGIMDAFKAAA